MPHEEFEDLSFDELEVTKRTGIIKEVIQRRDDVFSYFLELTTAMKFYPGQYILVDYNLEGKRVVRAYTMISSSLDESIIELNIQRTKDALTSHLITSKSIGDEFSFRGPYGKFVYTDAVKSKTIGMVAVNIGINTFISMLRYIEEKNLDVEIIMYYMWEGDNVLFDDILQEKKERINFKLNMVNLEDISKEEIDQIDLLYICGEKRITNPFMDSLRKWGVDKDKIRLEQWF
ncbi:MAG: FAD-dependent oxidoreductase [Candidatus Heimdallarchaeota archaeon]|nr:FAD-dependent oxidoreductase [Candidatus Heimdallarchaeota archaeon]